MIAKCTDNIYTWRNVLTIGKEYQVIRLFNDKYEGHPMVDVKCDDGVIRTYRASRFNLY